MPPISATFDEETSQIISAIGRRQNDILQFQIPRLRACKGPLIQQQNLAGEVREDVDNISRQIEVRIRSTLIMCSQSISRI